MSLLLFGRKPKEFVPPDPPGQPPRPKVRRAVLELICASAQSQDPNEFGGMLRMSHGVISELVVLPGTISGHSHAIFNFNMLPIDFSVKGTVHSHPSGNPLPSEADVQLFRKYGNIHIIVGAPYDLRSWRAYNGRGEAIQLQVVDD